MLTCTRCHAPLPVDVVNTSDMTRCPSCHVWIKAEIFPAFFRPHPGNLSDEFGFADDDAGCFYHPKKKAVVVCSACGRFLCPLCDVELKGEHRCPSCVETGKRKGRLYDLETHRVLYDNIALFLAIFPLVFFFVTLITAPAVLFIVVRYWNAPLSIVKRSRFRFIAASVLAGLQMIGWGWVFWIWVT